MTKITENVIEKFCIELLEKQGYEYIYAPDIAPDKVNGKVREGALGYSDNPQRSSFEDVLLPKLMSGEIRIACHE